LAAPQGFEPRYAGAAKDKLLKLLSLLAGSRRNRYRMGRSGRLLLRKLLRES
jgi:hypothetical protein